MIHMYLFNMMITSSLKVHQHNVIANVIICRKLSKLKKDSQQLDPPTDTKYNAESFV